MTNENLYEVFGEISEKHIKAAHVDREKAKKRGWMKWGAVAACLCLIVVTAITAVPSFLQQKERYGGRSDRHSSFQKVVAAQGFLTLTAYASSPEEDMAGELPSAQEIVMQEGIEIPVNENWNPAMSSRPGIPLKLSAPEYPDIIFEIMSDGGELLLWKGDKITNVEIPFHAGNGTTIYWSGISQTADTQIGERDSESHLAQEAFINIVIREGENIIGYAVIKLYTNDSDKKKEQIPTYYAKLLKSVSYPKVNGKYQTITDKYVVSEMKRIKGETADKGGR